MARLRKVGTAIVLTSALKEDEIKKVSKFAPAALVLLDEDKEVIFKVGLSERRQIGKYGVAFNSKNTAGSAELTVMTDLKDKEAVTEEYGVIIANLQKVEAQVAAALEDVKAVFASVENNIEVE